MAALAAVVLAGCQGGQEGPAPQDVAAFEDQMTDFLAERPAISEVDVSEASDHEVLVTIVLADGLSDLDVVQEVWEIADHELEEPLPYGLQVRVPATTVDGAPATAAFHLAVPEPVADTDEARDGILSAFQDSRALVALATGPTTMTATGSGTELETGGDPG